MKDVITLSVSKGEHELRRNIVIEEGDLEQVGLSAKELGETLLEINESSKDKAITDAFVDDMDDDSDDVHEKELEDESRELDKLADN